MERKLTQTNKWKLSSIAKDICFDEPMNKHTTFRIGGCAEAYINASSSAEVVAVVIYCTENNIPYIYMGNGSNVLVSDEGIPGVVISVGNNMSNVQVVDNMIYADAGAMMSKVAAAARNAGLTGFEELSGIPGTIGGGIYMNAGAYGKELKDVIKNVTYIMRNNDVVTVGVDELDLSYRHSVFEENGGIIVGCCIELEHGNTDEISAKMADYAQRRRDKQPIELPSAGSTFKRPEGYFAGKLIQESGLMGYSVGGAQVSEKHAGFVVNKGGATAADVMELIKDVQRIVKEKTGVDLEPEVKQLG